MNTKIANAKRNDIDFGTDDGAKLVEDRQRARVELRRYLLRQRPPTDPKPDPVHLCDPNRLIFEVCEK